MSDTEKKYSGDDVGDVAISTVSEGREAGVTDEGMALANDPHRSVIFSRLSTI